MTVDILKCTLKATKLLPERILHCLHVLLSFPSTLPFNFHVIAGPTQEVKYRLCFDFEGLHFLPEP